MYLAIAATIPRANTQGNAAGVCIAADNKRSLRPNQEVVSQQQRQHPSGHAAIHSDSKLGFSSPPVKLLHRGDGPVGHQYHGEQTGCRVKLEQHARAEGAFARQEDASAEAQDASPQKKASIIAPYGVCTP